MHIFANLHKISVLCEFNLINNLGNCLIFYNINLFFTVGSLYIYKVAHYGVADKESVACEHEASAVLSEASGR